MNRFKFRAWDGKTMHYDFMVAGFELSNAIGVLWDEDYAREKYKVKEWKLMQCTGLTDMEGKLIYEGDLISNNYGTNKQVVREINQGQKEFKGCWVAVRVSGNSGMNEVCLLGQIHLLNFKVIGNIYERVQK